jgi:hypothetical protein
MWATARQDLKYIIKSDETGAKRLSMPGKGFDFGNYKSGYTGVYAMLMDTAREFGDYEIADAALRALDEDCGRADDGGVLRYSKGSNLSNAMAMRARIHRRDDFRRTIAEGPPEASLRGPILTDAKYPEVLVARAFSNSDDLELVLYPGAKPGPHEIRIERLRPGAKYAMRNGSEHAFTADNNGRASRPHADPYRSGRLIGGTKRDAPAAVRSAMTRRAAFTSAGSASTLSTLLCAATLAGFAGGAFPSARQTGLFDLESASFGFSRRVSRDVQTRTVRKKLRGRGELNSAKRSSREKSRAARTDRGSTTRERRCEMHRGAHANRTLDRIGDHDFDSGGPRQSRNFDASSRASEPRCFQDEVVGGIMLDKRAERRGAAE